MGDELKGRWASWWRKLTGAGAETPESGAVVPGSKAAAGADASGSSVAAVEPEGGIGKAAKALFYRKWKDKAFLSEIRALGAYMVRDGVNIKNFKDVKAWLEKNEEGIKAGRFKSPPPSASSHAPYVKTGPDAGRNDPCPCGSGKKFKKCCGAK